MSDRAIPLKITITSIHKGVFWPWSLEKNIHLTIDIGISLQIWVTQALPQPPKVYTEIKNSIDKGWVSDLEDLFLVSDYNDGRDRDTLVFFMMLKNLVDSN